MDNKYINGPINIIRLTGEINGTKKILYIFMGEFFSIYRETHCDDIHAININNFFINIFDNNPDLIFDFFFPVSKSALPTEFNNFRGSYLDELYKLFGLNFNYNKDKNQVSKSKLIPNTRFHYIDFENYLAEIYKIGDLLNIISRDQFILPEDIQKIKTDLNSVITQFRELFEYIKSNYKSEIPDKNPEALIFNKLFHKYKNKNIQKIIIKIIQNYLFPIYYKTLEDINKFISELEPLSNLISQKDLNKNKIGITYGMLYSQFYQILAKLYINFEIINSKLTVFNNRLSDLYFLRRFLDKNYITNGIIYCHISRPIIYLYILIKYFDFKITNYVYLLKSPAEFEKQIKSIPDSDLDTLEEYIYPPLAVECVLTKNFPSNF